MKSINPNLLQDWLSPLSSSQGTYREFRYITNRDSSIRWIWPAESKQPNFLRFYSATSWKAKSFVALVKLAFVLRLPGLVSKKKSAWFGDFRSELDLDTNGNWAIFTGTKGPNRKLLIYGKTQNGKSTFVKWAIGENAPELLEQEKTTLNYLYTLNLANTNFPEVVSSSEKTLQLSDVGTARRASSLTSTHLAALRELYVKTQKTLPLSDSSFLLEIKENLQNSNQIKDSRIPSAMRRKLQWTLESVNAENQTTVAFAHGDFTPWNCFLSEGSLGLYDLELGKQEMPKYFDAFHFVIQNSILVDRKPWSQIIQEIKKTILPTLFDNNVSEMEHYLQLYLLSNISKYLLIYEQQKDWHTQVDWLLNTWNDALSWFLQKTVSARELVLMDIFDFVQNKNYVALKFKGYLPEQVSEMSDVDLCISKNNAVQVYEYLQHHSLVKSVRSKHLSFMKNYEIILNNNEFLSLDCIWKLKRKSLVMMDIERLVDKSVTNPYGIKQPSMDMESLYINIFHLLNYSQPKLAQRNKSFEIELEDKAGSTDRGDMRTALIDILKQKSINQGLHLVRNRLDYVLDTARNLFTRRGFIVTFSGVDGAGKSTLIDITKKNINKQLRRPIVVLRHRPSLLPILSAWTMGKAAAEQKAATTLPRQGGNQSTLSSLVRFTYYYADYFFGQFYVYFKYVLRGKVVIYDRYYFDFINDSKRSNINLPNWLTTFGFNFLLKPEVNFFLYADSATILARKQELDADTIDNLTDKYLTLFDKLNKRAKSKRYHPVKNIKLDDTVNSIMQTLRTEAA